MLVCIFSAEGIPSGIGREGPVKKRQIQSLFLRYAGVAGIEGRSIHSPRHSIVVHLLEAGRGIEYVADHCTDYISAQRAGHERA
jgi:integrase